MVIASISAIASNALLENRESSNQLEQDITVLSFGTAMNHVLRSSARSGLE